MKIDIDIKNGEGDTPLHLSIRNNHLEIINFLMEEGADLNIKYGLYHATPLYCAVRSGHKDMVELLIDKGADINEVSRIGSNSFFIAVGRGHKDVIRLLLDKGADVGAKNLHKHQFTGTTKNLHKAAKFGDIKQVRKL